MKRSDFDAAIVGGGAAGLAAAVTYLKRKHRGRLLLIEANEECGKKLLATGNGRCNISNLSASEYYSVKKFFKDIGVLFRIEENGCVYPMSGQAASVRDAFLNALRREEAQILSGSRVSRIEKNDENGFIIYFEEKEPVYTKRLLIATGGKAGPQFGCLGDGYAFAKGLGHNVESIRPALVPLTYTEAEKARLSGLAGVRIKAQAELYIDGKRITASSGELQFTEYVLLQGRGICRSR